MTQSSGCRTGAGRGWWTLALAFCLCAGLAALALAGLDRVQASADSGRPVIRQTVSLDRGVGVVRAGQVSMTLALMPLPVRLMQDHRAVVTVLVAGRPVRDASVTLRLRMPSQPTIDLTVAMQAMGEGRYASQVVLPLCTREPSQWLAEVRVDRTYGATGAGFRFDVTP
ncbi:MAG: FixH family protein [Candidatus Sericytochromatia bacterium]|nr:FixH family protein [Candidatus Sericytochromatia bacterium]